jgi:tetratricopeptide (TPR) repeat protein
MGKLLGIAFCVGLTLSGSAAVGQANPTSEQQLANGFLGERNAQMVGHDPAPNETYADQAMRAINLKQYKRALDILKPHRLANDPAYFYLAGRAQEGLGDYSAARKNLTTAIKKNKNFIGAHRWDCSRPNTATRRRRTRSSTGSRPARPNAPGCARMQQASALRSL